MDAQLTSCMLANRTADSWLNLENECIFCRFDLGGTRPSETGLARWSIHRYQRSQRRDADHDCEQERNVQRRPESERWDFEFLTTLKGSPCNPNPPMHFPLIWAVPVPVPAPIPQVVVAAAPVDRAASRLYMRRSDVQKYGCSMMNKSWMQICDGRYDGARAHTEECRKRLENCLAEDEETKFRSEATKFRVDNWLASRVESAESSARVTQPSGPSSSSAAAASSSSAAAEQFRGDEIPDQGVKRVRWSPRVEGESRSDTRGLKRQPESTTGGPGRRW